MSLPFSKTSLVKYINIIVHIRQLCRKISALAYHRCLNYSSVEVINNTGATELDVQCTISHLNSEAK